MASTSKKAMEKLGTLPEKLSTLPGWNNSQQQVTRSNTEEITVNNNKSQEESTLEPFVTTTGTQGKKGQKTPRMNLAIQEDVYEYIRRESRKNGLTYSEFICAVMRERKQRLGEF